jgi:hypothetical protein
MNCRLASKQLASQLSAARETIGAHAEKLQAVSQRSKHGGAPVPLPARPGACQSLSVCRVLARIAQAASVESERREVARAAQEGQEGALEEAKVRWHARTQAGRTQAGRQGSCDRTMRRTAGRGGGGRMRWPSRTSAARGGRGGGHMAAACVTGGGWGSPLCVCAGCLLSLHRPGLLVRLRCLGVWSNEGVPPPPPPPPPPGLGAGGVAPAHAAQGGEPAMIVNLEAR